MQLKDTKKLFITAELPDSAVLGEDVCFTALVYNLLQDPVEAWISLKKNASGFQNVLVSQDVREPSVVTQAYKSVRAKTGLGTVSCTGWVEGRRDGWMDGWMDGWKIGRIDGLMEEWNDDRKGGWIDGRKDNRKGG